MENPPPAPPPDANTEPNPNHTPNLSPNSNSDSNSEVSPLPAGVYPMTLLVNKETNKVLFAEGDSAVFSGLVKLLRFSIGEFHSFLVKNRENSLRKLSSSLASLGARFNWSSKPEDRTRYYRCTSCGDASPYVTDRYATHCALCEGWMIEPVDSDLPGGEPDDEDGDMTERRKKYLVMDDLTVQPCVSVVSTISLLSSFNVSDPSVLEEQIAFLTLSSAVQILEASMTSSTVLSDVFLKEEEKPKPKSRGKRSLDKKAKPEPTRRSLRRKTSH